MVKKSIYNKLKSGAIQQGEALFPLHGCHTNKNWVEQVPEIDWKKVNYYMEQMKYEGD